MKELPPLFEKAIEGIAFSSENMTVLFNAYLSSNRSALEILSVYAFWLVAGRWL
jgi:hypothetical protein